MHVSDRTLSRAPFVLGAVAVAMTLWAVASSSGSSSSFGQLPVVGHPLGCNIKGNISQTTGEHIYHVPGQRYYDATVIDPAAGERWFCSEQEAIQAGWRKSKV
jgi:hypothetical protein